MRNCSCSCGSDLRRLNRVGFLERNVFAKLGIYPWECVLCRNRVYRLADGRMQMRRDALHTAA